MPFEPGLSRSWYIKGRVAARTGKWADMYEAWHSAKGKPTISGKRVTAQESFFQGYIDVPQKNPASIPAQIRRLPSGEIQLKLSLKGAHAKQQAQAIRKALGKRVKAAVVTGIKNPSFIQRASRKHDLIRRALRKVGLKKVLQTRNPARRRKR